MAYCTLQGLQQHVVGQGIVQFVPSLLSIMQLSWKYYWMDESLLHVKIRTRVSLKGHAVSLSCLLVFSVFCFVPLNDFPNFERIHLINKTTVFWEPLKRCDLLLCSSVLVASVRHWRIRVNFPEGRRGSRRAANDVFFPQMEQIVSAASPLSSPSSPAIPSASASYGSENAATCSCYDKCLSVSILASSEKSLLVPTLSFHWLFFCARCYKRGTDLCALLRYFPSFN